MQLNYMQKDNGMYIISRNGIEQIANSVLKEYSPRHLENPAPLNTVDFLENYLGLTLKHKYIGTVDSGILGLIVMNDSVEIPSYDLMFRQTVLEETYGTVLISPHLMRRDNLPRKRYTEVHEGAHFLLHKPYYQKLEERSRDKTIDKPIAYIACRKVEIHNENPKDDRAWMEWQADTLAASLLMPQEVFASCARSVMRRYGIYRGYLLTEPYTNKRQAYDILSEIAEIFRVSYRATQIRMLHLNLIRSPSRYV